MRILHTVENYYPSVGGAQEVIRQISEHLVRRGHEVVVVTSQHPQRNFEILNGVHLISYNIHGNLATGIHGEVECYQNFLLHGNFDIMLNYCSQQWATDLVFSLIDRLPYRKIIAPMGLSALNRPEFQEYYSNLPNFLRSYDRILLHASNFRDAQFARVHGLQNTVLIPNGADENEFGRPTFDFRKKYHINPNTILILSVSSHLRLKGHRLVLEAFRRARIGSAMFTLIGNTIGRSTCLQHDRLHARLIQFLSLGKKRILLLSPPREEVVAAYQAANLFLFASRVEYSPLVLFEAMASCTPYVSSDCGNSAEITSWSNSGIVVPGYHQDDGSVETDPSKLARAVEELIHDPERRYSMGEKGFRAWKERFTWEFIANQYETLYLELISNKS